MPSQIEKLEAYSAILLDGMLALKESYSILDPMLFDRTTITRAGGGDRARGFNHLLLTLYVHCCQDVAKLSLDADERTPSVKNIVEKLSSETLRRQLRENYALCRVPIPDSSDDPEMSEALRRLALQDQLERWTQFDHHYENLVAKWDVFYKSPELAGMALVRDKISAHTEIKYVVDKYAPFPIDQSGLKWDDLKKAIAHLQEIVELIGFLVRRAGFAWEMLDDNLIHSANQFWKA